MVVSMKQNCYAKHVIIGYLYDSANKTFLLLIWNTVYGIYVAKNMIMINTLGNPSKYDITNSLAIEQCNCRLLFGSLVKVCTVRNGVVVTVLKVLSRCGEGDISREENNTRNLYLHFSMYCPIFCRILTVFSILRCFQIVSKAV